MGIVAVIGFAIAIVVVLTAMVSRRAWSRRQPELWAYGVLAAVALAFYTKDGLGALFALFVGPEIRTWLRLYVVIGMFGLLAIGRLLTTMGAKRGFRWEGLACAFVLVVGVLDQTNPGAAPNYAANRQQLASISALTSELESRLEPGCSVFQVLIVRLPAVRRWSSSRTMTWSCRLGLDPAEMELWSDWLHCTGGAGRELLQPNPSLCSTIPPLPGFAPFRWTPTATRTRSAARREPRQKSASPSQPPLMGASSPSTFDLAESSGRAPGSSGSPGRWNRVLNPLPSARRRLSAMSSEERTRDRLRVLRSPAGDLAAFGLTAIILALGWLEMAPADGHDFRPMYRAGWTVPNGTPYTTCRCSATHPSRRCSSRPSPCSTGRRRTMPTRSFNWSWRSLAVPWGLGCSVDTGCPALSRDLGHDELDVFWRSVHLYNVSLLMMTLLVIVALCGHGPGGPQAPWCWVVSVAVKRLLALLFFVPGATLLPRVPQQEAALVLALTAAGRSLQPRHRGTCSSSAPRPPWRESTRRRSDLQRQPQQRGNHLPQLAPAMTVIRIALLVGIVVTLWRAEGGRTPSRPCCSLRESWP